LACTQPLGSPSSTVEQQTVGSHTNAALTEKMAGKENDADMMQKML